MKYRDKCSKVIVEAVKWDGNIETIKNNKWLEDVLKENKIVLTTNYINNKEIILFKKVKDLFSDDKNIREIKNNDYIIKENNGKILFTGQKIFEDSFESLEENKSKYVSIKSTDNVASTYDKKKIILLQSKCYMSNEKNIEIQKRLSKQIGMKVVIIDYGLEVII